MEIDGEVSWGIDTYCVASKSSEISTSKDEPSNSLRQVDQVTRYGIVD